MRVVPLGIDIYTVMVFPIVYILPAYVANGAPVIFGGGAPLDMGRKLRGKPILGSHKTIKGTVAGLLAGFLVAYIESFFLGYMLAVGVMLSLGTHAGDITGSFIKRRLGRKEGAKSLVLDQYLFLVMALLFAAPLGIMPNVYGLLFIFVLTGVLHKATNMAAYKAKIKKVPW